VLTSQPEIFIDGETGRSYSFSKLKDATVAFGKGLKSQWGFKKGDVLGVFSPNSIDYGAVIWGALWAGGVCSTANPTYTVKELAFQLKDSNVTGVVTQLATLPVVLEAAKQIGLPEDRILLLGDSRDATGQFKHFTDLKDTSLFGQSKTKVDPQKDLAFLVYSSGTTGLPKGVMLKHSNIVANVIQATFVESQSGLHPLGGLDGKGDKQIAVLPFFHVYVSMREITYQVQGLTVRFRASQTFFTPPCTMAIKLSYCQSSSWRSFANSSRTTASPLLTYLPQLFSGLQNTPL
jgi:4-coumarate--CoA ligase